MKINLFVAMPLAALCAQPVGMAMANDNLGTYAGVRMAMGKIDATETKPWGQKVKRESGSEFSGGLFAGYAFHPNWGLEVTVASLGEYAYALNGIGTIKDQLELSSFSTALTGRLPLAAHFAATAKLGAAYVRTTRTTKGNSVSNANNEAVISAFFYDAKYSENNIVPLMAVALDYQLNREVGLQLGYERYPSISFGDNAKLDASLWVFNVSYSFGR